MSEASEAQVRPNGRRPAAIVAVVVAVVAIVAGGVGAVRWFTGTVEGVSPGMDLKTQCVRDGRVLALVETYRDSRPAWEHDSTVDNVKGYLIVADAPAGAGAGSKVRVYGPLYEVPNQRSGISFQTGAQFTAADAKAAAATPHVAFGPDGQVIRWTGAGAPRAKWDRLVVRDDSAAWEPGGEYATPPSRQWGSEDRVRSNSGAYLLQKEDDAVRFYDAVTGRQKPDPWLEGAFADLRGRAELGNIHIHLTDDLRYLVVVPEWIWNTDKPGGGRQVYETFHLDGKEYPRVEYGLVYIRDQKGPALFKRPQHDPPEKLGAGPRDAFSINGALFLLYVENGNPRLVSPDGKKVLEPRAPPPAPVRDVYVGNVRHDPARGVLIFFRTNDITKEHDADETLTAVTWNYGDGSMTKQDVSLLGCFKRRGDRYEPKQCLPVR